MSKKKSNIGFSIENDLISDFNSYCESRSINKSKLVNKIIKDFLKDESKLGKKEENKVQDYE